MEKKCSLDCPISKEEVCKLKNDVETLNHKIFGGENPENSLVTTVSQIKNGMDLFNRNASRFMTIFGVLIVMAIFNSGMYWKQQRVNEKVLENNSLKIEKLEQKINDVLDINLDKIWNDS